MGLPKTIEEASPSASRQRDQSRQSHNETAYLPDGDTLTQNEYPKQRGDDETHLCDRHQHARFAASHAAQQANGGAEQHNCGWGAVFERRRGRSKLTVSNIDHDGGERREQDSLRNRERFGQGTVRSPRVWKKFQVPNASVAIATCTSERRVVPPGARSGLASAPRRSQVATNASVSPASLPGVNGSRSNTTTSTTVTTKFSRKIAALMLTAPAARLRMK